MDVGGHKVFPYEWSVSGAMRTELAVLGRVLVVVLAAQGNEALLEDRSTLKLPHVAYFPILLIFRATTRFLAFSH